MEFFSWYVYVAWVPLLLWVALFFWFWRFSSALPLKKMMKKGKKWAVVPVKFTKNPGALTALRMENFAFSLVSSVLSGYSICWIVEKLHVCNPLYGFASIVVFLILAVILYKIAVKSVLNLYQAAYFLEYRKVRYETEKKGTFHNEADIHNRTIWSFTKKLKNAEAHGRLWKYVNAMAKTKKIPPDILAEIAYV